MSDEEEEEFENRGITWPEVVMKITSGIGALLFVTIFLFFYNHESLLANWRKTFPLTPCAVTATPPAQPPVPPKVA